MNIENVKKLAKAILEDPLTYMNGDYTPYYYCSYCEATLEGYGIKVEDFIHNIDCPVITAGLVLKELFKSE